jgi:hypothetical protein
MTILAVMAVANLLATGALGWLVVTRTKHRPPLVTPSSQPTAALHRIAAFHLDGSPLPDLYHGDDDHEVKRKWDALKQARGSGHFELWHARHGKRDEFTRRLASLR